MMVPAGTVLYTTRAPIGYVAIAGQPVCTNQGFKSFVPGPDVSSDYLYWYLRYFTPAIREMGSGTTFKEVSKKVAKAIPLLVPPLNEQQQIAVAIEEHLSRVDNADQSVRSASARLRALEAAGLVLPRDGWPERPFGDVTDNHDGKRVPVRKSDRENRAGEYPYYGAQGIIDTIDDFLFDGDYLLVAEDGANLVSRAKPLAFRASGRFWVNNHAHVVTPTSGVMIEYLEIAVNSLDVGRFISGSAQPKLTQANLNRLPISVPSLDVQVDVVARWSALSTGVRHLREELWTAQRRLASLHASILREAFAGRLIPGRYDDDERLRA